LNGKECIRLRDFRVSNYVQESKFTNNYEVYANSPPIVAFQSKLDRSWKHWQLTVVPKTHAQQITIADDPGHFQF